MKIYERFILEPRSPYSNRGSSDNCYLVVYDSIQKQFLSEGPHNKYLKFKTSKEAFKFLVKNYQEEI